jgi:RNA polymerase sigma-70 factor (ECF subfamily)
VSGAATIEAQLLARAREGDGAARDAACREIYEALRPRVFRVCLQLCGERTLAEDAMQNAFLAAFRGLRTFRGDAQLSTWIYRVAIREALALRARRPRAAEIAEAAQVPSDAAPVDAQVAARQQARAVQAAFRTLSAEHQAVLSLFAVEGLKHRQIAEVLGIAEGTVWYRLHEARKALRAEVAPATP